MKVCMENKRYSYERVKFSFKYERVLKKRVQALVILTCKWMRTLKLSIVDEKHLPP